ncbi:MAG: hypothetical protein ABI972_22105 [Acidobacteriota bacterium]
MKIKLLLLATAITFTSLAQAQPRITNVTNAASYAAAGLPGVGIAQGSIFVIFGSNMGPAALVQAGAPRPTAAGLSGTRVRITVGATNFDAPMIYTSAGQVAAIMPSNVQVGQANVIVLFNDVASSPFPVAVVRFGLGIFTLNSAGTGPGVVTDANYTAVTFTTSMNPGQAGIIWATGLGGTTPAEDINGAAGAIPNVVQVEIFIGGKVAPVLYAGRSPGFTGLDQINFSMPDVEGCAVPLVIRLNGGNGIVSNFVSTSVARSGRTCHDRGFTEAEFQSAANGTLRLGSLSLGRTTTKVTTQGFDVQSRTDFGSASFIKFDYNTLIRSSSVASPPPGSCIVSTYGANPGTDPALATITPLDAGASIGVNGPNGAKTLAKTTPGFYSAQLGGGTTISGLPPGVPNPFPPGAPDYLSSGEYTFTGPGGADVGAFTARFTYPQPLTWTNEASITAVNRTQNLNITWSGGAANDLVVISGSSSNTNPAVGANFICYATASAGSFSVPSWVLSALPISSSAGGAPTGILLVGNTSLDPSRFTASGIDIGVLSYSNFGGKNLNYQ